MPTQFADPQTRTVTAATITLPAAFSWVTFNNTGAGAATITFATGDSVVIPSGDTLTLPYVGRVYDDIEVAAPATTVLVIFIP